MTILTVRRAALFGHARLVLLGAVIVWSAPAAAFDTLLALLRGLPAGEIGESEFDFAAPRVQAGWPVMALQGIGYDEINRTLIDRNRGLNAAGVAFPDLDGMLRAGRPPNTVIYLTGRDIAAAAMRSPLLARPGMTERTADTFTIFSQGADFAVDLAAMDAIYPFGGGYRAHRVAVRKGLAVVAFADAPLLAAIDAVVAPSDASPWVGLIEAGRSLVPAGFTAYAASGVPANAFNAPSDMPAQSTIVVASIGPEGEATQFLLAFDDAAAAEHGAEALAAALAAIRDWPEGAEVRVDTAPFANGVAAAVTVLFPPEEEHPSSALLNRWRSDIFSGRFPPSGAR